MSPFEPAAAWEKADPALRASDGFVRLSEVEERAVDWFWEGRIARASVAVIAGDGGVGKSTLAQELAARVSRGQAPPHGFPAPPRGVLILTSEEDASAVVRPRLRLMGADLERVVVLNPEEMGLTLPRDAERLASRARDEDAGLIVMDTGPAFLDRGLKSIAEEDIRAFIAPLRAIAEELRLVAIILAHLNKDTSRDSRRRVMGGSAWVNAPRHVLLVGAPPGMNPRETGDRLVAVEKNNLGVYPPAIAFRLAPARDDPTRAIVVWGGEVAGVQASDLVAEAPGEEERSERDAAREFLTAELESGPRPVKELKQAASAAGMGWRTVERAKTDIGARAKKDGDKGSWRWHPPPPDGDGESKAATSREARRSGGLGGLGGLPLSPAIDRYSPESSREGRQDSDRQGAAGGLRRRPLPDDVDDAALGRFEALAAAATDPVATAGGDA